jgi:autotransporter-associated beta strand protein
LNNPADKSLKTQPSQNRMNPRKTCSILSAASALMLAPAAFAQDGTWAITSNGSWNTSGNWSGGIIAGNSTSTAFFNNVDIPAGNTTVTLDGNRTINKLVFGDTATGTAGAWIIAAGSPAGTLTLAGTTPAITTNVTTTISARLQGTNGFTKDGPGTLILNYADNATNISGNVVVSAGTLSIQSKALTYATSVAINGGTLVSATTTANAIGGTISFGGGTLQYNQNPGTDYSAQFSTAANQQYRINVITAAGPVDRVATFSTNLSSEGGTLTKLGTGVLILNAANTFNGATTVSAGTLQLNNSLALQNSPINTTGSITGNSTQGIILNAVTTPTFGGLTGDKNLASLFNTSTGNYSSVTNVTLNPGTGASHSYSGVIADGATGMSLTKSGVGTQTLTGPNTYTGATTVSAGTLTLGASGVISDSSVVNLDGGILNTADGVVETLHSIQATTGKLLLGNSSALGSADITLLNDSVVHNIDVGLNGTLRLAANKTLTQTATGVTAQLAAGDSLTLDIGTGGFAHLSGVINSGGGDGAVIKTGNGTLRVTGATSQWGGNTLIENGTLEFNTIANFDIVSSLGDGDNGGTNDAIIQIGSASTAATLKMIGTEAKNSSNRTFQLGNAGGTIGVDNIAQTLTLSGIISNADASGTLTKDGAGTLVLSGPNTYSGGTTVSNGILLVNNTTGSGTGNGTVAVDGGATLGGTGTIAGAVNVSGVLSPGTSIESLGTGALTLINGSTFKYEMDTATVGGDLLYVTGGLNIGTNVTLDLTDLAAVSQVLAVGTKFTLLSYTGLWDNGTFTGYADDSTFSFASNEWLINYNDLTGGSNFTSDQAGATGFVTLTVIPEPSSSALLGLGGLAALLVRRRRRN